MVAPTADVADEDGWSDWSQWSHCTKNISGIQARVGRCTGSNPQLNQKKCPGQDVTVIRGCTNISRCDEGISQMLKKNIFVCYTIPPQDFLNVIHSLLIWEFFAVLVLICAIPLHFWNS